MGTAASLPACQEDMCSSTGRCAWQGERQLQPQPGVFQAAAVAVTGLHGSTSHALRWPTNNKQPLSNNQCTIKKEKAQPHTCRSCPPPQTAAAPGLRRRRLLCRPGTCATACGGGQARRVGLLACTTSRGWLVGAHGAQPVLAVFAAAAGAAVSCTPMHTPMHTPMETNSSAGSHSHGCCSLAHQAGGVGHDAHKAHALPRRVL